MTETERVAPREIVDLVYRASRVRGCDSSAANRVAAEVAFCETHHGGGLAAWAALVDDAPGRLAESVLSSCQIDLVAALARTEGVSRTDWNPPIPFALVAGSVRSCALRGLKWSAAPAEPMGTDPVSTMELSAAERSDSRADWFAERSRSALAEGLLVDRVLWSRLDQEAAGFLLSEAVLDAPVGRGSSRSAHG